MSDEIVIPTARARSRTWQEAAAFAERFPTIPKPEIVAILMEAQGSADLFGLSRDEGRRMAERIAAAILRQRTGEAGDGARLDPEKHERRRKSS